MKQANTRKTPGKGLLLLLPVLAVVLAAVLLNRGEKKLELPYLTSGKAVVMDRRTGKLLYEKDAHSPWPPASLTKLMTAYLLLDDLSAGSLDWEEPCQITPEDAAATGSKYGVEPGETYTVRQLMAGVLLQSGCDCVHALVERSGGEAAFVERMNRKAEELGLEGSRFVNATGLDASGHYMTAADLAKLSRSLLKDHPEILDFTREPELVLGDRYFKNSHLLVGFDPRVLGLKTGTTQLGGNHLVTYCQKGKEEYLIVLLDCGDPIARFTETQTILNALWKEGDNG